MLLGFSPCISGPHHRGPFAKVEPAYYRGLKQTGHLTGHVLLSGGYENEGEDNPGERV
jgi:hypothetical protein